jgi:hypothetical protein
MTQAVAKIKWQSKIKWANEMLRGEITLLFRI